MSISTLFLLSAVVLVFCMPISAHTSDDVEWKMVVDSTTLRWADSVTNGEYVIIAEDFDKESLVYIAISKDGHVREYAPLGVGDELIADGEIKVCVRAVDPDIKTWADEVSNPSVAIRIYRRGLPSLNIKIITDEELYDPKSSSTPSTITATITVKNTGDAKIENVDLAIDTGGLELTDGDLTYQYTQILKGKSMDAVVIKMKTPLSCVDTTSFIISAEAKGYDMKGVEYKGSVSIPVSIAKNWELIVAKAADEKIYMTETTHVHVDVINMGICDLDSITITDVIAEDFELKESTTLEKTISLKAGTRELFGYVLKPTMPGTFTVPAVTARFTAPNGKEHAISSETPRITVYGPNIVLTKTVSRSNVNSGDEVKVTVNVQNIGNVDASVTASDSLPSTATFVSGDTGFKELLKSGSSKSFSYVIRMKTSDEVKLPAATARFIDRQGYNGERVSNTVPRSPVTEGEDNPVVEVDEDQTVTITPPHETIQKEEQAIVVEQVDRKVEVPGFETIAVCTTLVCIYFLCRHRKVQ